MLMKLEFVKMHGLGNDFVMVDDFSREIELNDEQVQQLCDRHFGIGADGVILVRPSEHSECSAYMHYINSDGSLAQMCGNGVRCFAKYLVDRGYVSAHEGSFVADTLAGPRPISFRVDEHEQMIDATVDMGHPILTPAQVPVTFEANAETDSGRVWVREAPLDSPWGTFHFTCVSMGNPHAICFLPNLDTLDARLFADGETRSLASMKIDEIGAFFESHPSFPEKTNVEFVVVDAEGLHMRVFERGCGETLACGTGACATAVAVALTKRAGRESVVHLRGGDLHITWDEDTDHVFMRGEATQSFTGTVEV